uniref:Putative ovule protein n=1 Tax=Solanum chacoense TaxID=4108 RepID=A0A0V0GSP4_SOLCH
MRFCFVRGLPPPVISNDTQPSFFIFSITNLLCNLKMDTVAQGCGLVVNVVVESHEVSCSNPPVERRKKH